MAIRTRNVGVLSVLAALIVTAVLARSTTAADAPNPAMSDVRVVVERTSVITGQTKLAYVENRNNGRSVRVTVRVRGIFLNNKQEGYFVHQLAPGEKKFVHTKEFGSIKGLQVFDVDIVGAEYAS